MARDALVRRYLGLPTTTMLDRLPSTTDDVILHGLSPAALITYSKICKTTQRIAESYIKREFSLNRVLSRYFSPLELLRLRYFQSQYQMLISGSTALQFFDRTCYPDSDLDLYVEHRFRETIVAWLIQMQYEFQPRKGYASLKEQLEFQWDDPTPGVSPSAPFFQSRSNGYFGRGVANVYNFFKYNPERKIQLITSNHSPLEIVLNFHSTCVMNIITHDKAYSLYPKATFEERRSLMISTEGSKQDTARAKYVSRGWTMVTSPSLPEINNPNSSFCSKKRYIGDSHCWTIPLSHELDTKSPEGFIESNTWALTYDSDYIPTMSFNILLTDCLDFSYLVVDDTLTNYLWPVICPMTGVQKRHLDRDVLQLVRWRRVLVPD